MPAQTTPLGVKFGWDVGENGWKPGMDTSLILLSVLCNGYVLEAGVNTPPSSPTIHDAYIVGASPTGAWAGKGDNVTVWSGSAWLFAAPQPGWRFYEDTTYQTLEYDYASGDWLPVVSPKTFGSSPTSFGEYINITSITSVDLTADQGKKPILYFYRTDSSTTLCVVNLPNTVQDGFWMFVNDSSAKLQVKVMGTSSGWQEVTLPPRSAMVVGAVDGEVFCASTGVADWLALPSYTVSSAPSASNLVDGKMIFVSDGASGSPCLAVSQGGAWKRVALGATISAT